MGNNVGLEAVRIRERLGALELIGREVVVLEEVDSTSDEVARRAGEGAREGLVVFAQQQRNGRGRRGARWESSPGENLLFSILLRPPGGAAGVPWLPMATALALCRVFEALYSLPATIKWPNDVYLAGGRKVAGILTEGRRRDEVVLGIGINVNAERFEGELAESATSLLLASGLPGPLDRATLAGAVLTELEAVYLDCQREGTGRMLEEAGRCSFLIGQRVVVQLAGKTIEGDYAGLGPEGEMRLSRVQDPRNADQATECLIRAADQVRVVG